MANKEPEKIEKEIYDVRDRIENTVDQITDKLSLKSVMRSFLSDDTENGNGRVATDSAVQLVKQNPLAVGLIGAGVAWLVSGKKTHPSEFNSKNDAGESTSKFDVDNDYARYVDKMSQLRRDESESDTVYHQRRRDVRSAYLMTERRTGEDDKSFEDRLDEATSKIKQKADKTRKKFEQKFSDSKQKIKAAVSDTRSKGDAMLSDAQDYSEQLSDRVRNKGQASLEKSQQVFDENPAVVGLAIAAVGAIIGTISPISQTERDKLKKPSQKLRTKAKSQADKLAKKAEDKISV